jgi:hypothetical protein
MPAAAVPFRATPPIPSDQRKAPPTPALPRTHGSSSRIPHWPSSAAGRASKGADAISGDESIGLVAPHPRYHVLRPSVGEVRAFTLDGDTLTLTRTTEDARIELIWVRVGSGRDAPTGT